jgi:hypothetical protein
VAPETRLELRPATPPFPDCWLAYGATNAELAAYGADRPLNTGATWAQGAAGLVLAVGLAALATVDGLGQLRWLVVALLVAVAGSALVAILRYLAIPGRLSLRRQHLVLRRPAGRELRAAWADVGEIALVSTRARAAVGLHLRRGGRPGEVATVPGRLARTLNGGFDALLVPSDSDCELLGRVLLRYAIDPGARRRLPSTR